MCVGVRKWRGYILSGDGSVCCDLQWEVLSWITGPSRYGGSGLRTERCKEFFIIYTTAFYRNFGH